jgi:superfamily II DNA/RNA helicase
MSFSDLLLPPAVVSTLAAAGFTDPSPVQRAAIPLLGGAVDVVVQAKSGTGKTLTFAVAVMQTVDTTLEGAIAVQTHFSNPKTPRTPIHGW